MAVPTMQRVAMARRMARMRQMRRPSPVNPGARARLETVRQPLYDSIVVTSGSTGAIPFFQEPFGQNGKTINDTNLEKGGSLSTPKVFDIHKFEIAISQARLDRTTGPPANEALANQNADWFNAIKTILYTTFLRFQVGDKPYLQYPTFLMPSNNVLDGGAVFAQPANATFANGLRTVVGQSVGMEFSVLRRRIRLLPDNQFRGFLNVPLALTNIGANGSHVIYLVLHGLLYREVQ